MLDIGYGVSGYHTINPLYDQLLPFTDMMIY